MLSGFVKELNILFERVQTVTVALPQVINTLPQCFYSGIDQLLDELDQPCCYGAPEYPKVKGQVSGRQRFTRA